MSFWLLFRIAMFSFQILAHDPRDDTVEFEARDAGILVLHAITRVTVKPGNVLVLSDFIVYGAGPLSLGQRLRQLARDFMQEAGCVELHIYGTRRTSGAGPGRFPGVVRFR